MMDTQTQTYQNTKLSEIVTENLQAAVIRENHHIDFYCGGQNPGGSLQGTKHITPLRRTATQRSNGEQRQRNRIH